MVIEYNEEKLIASFERRLKLSRYKAERLGYSYNIDIEFLFSIMVEECPIIEFNYLDWYLVDSKSDNYPVLVRIDVNGGYTKNNMMFVSKQAKDVRARFLNLLKPVA